MTRKLTFTEAFTQAAQAGYKMVHYAGSSNAYGSTFECGCGHVWSAKHNSVVSVNKTGCPKCAKDRGKFSAEEVRRAVEAEGFTLTSIDTEIRGQQTVVTTACGEGHRRTCKLGTVIYAKKPCPDCSKAQRGVDFSGLNTRLEPMGYRLTEWGGTTRSVGTFACKCGGSWKARVNSVLCSQSHCPVCFDGGFRGDKPAVFYIYELRKGRKLRYGYGVSGQFDRRDVEHRRNAALHGWSIRLFRIYEVSVGNEVLKVERVAKERFPVPIGMFDGFKTEAIMPRHLNDLLQLSQTLI